jgi:hypothetical protein
MLSQIQDREEDEKKKATGQGEWLAVFVLNLFGSLYVWGFVAGIGRAGKRFMDFFENAKTVRLKSHHGKYLLADDDHNAVSQDRDISSKGVLWTVEIVPGSGTIRLKSYYGKYLTASDHAFLLGMTGKKVLQSFASKADSALEWEPIAEGNFVKLKARNGNYLRANGGVPPWRNSVTHDVPVTSATQEWIFWKVDIMENKDPDPELAPAPVSKLLLSLCLC